MEDGSAAVDELGRLLAHDGERDAYFEDQRDRFLHDLALVARFHVGGRVLEVGSYPGYFSWCLKRLGYDAVGVDLDPSRTTAFDREHGLTVMRCDIERERLPFDDGRFRLVVCSEVFEHLRVDPLHALDEIHRALEPGGVLLLQTPNLYSVGNVARFVTGGGVFPGAYGEFSKLRGVGHMGHIREYSRAEVREFLARSGFEIVETRTLAHRPSHTGPITDLVYRLVPAFRPFQLWLARKPLVATAPSSTT
jgi:SAM-dependent methyltransferase